MPKRNGTDSKIPFDGQRPEYTTLTVEGVDTRFDARWKNYLKHYEEETGRKPDPGILLAAVVGSALTADGKFLQKEGSGHFATPSTNSNGAARGGAGGASKGGGGASAGGPGAN